MTDPFLYARGAPISVDLVIGTSTIDVTTASVQMVLKPLEDYTGAMPSKNTAPSATFEITFYPGTSTTLPFWRAEISAAVSETLLARNYTTTAWIYVGGVVVQTSSPVYITIYESSKP